MIVPVRNGARSLPVLLDSIASQTLAAERLEVIVVDNDSSDGTAEVAATGGARVFEEPVANRARARNRGAEEAKGALFAFTDADCVAHPEWLEALIACKDAGGLVAGEVGLTVSEPPNAIERFEQLWRFAQKAWVTQGWASTANLLVHAATFEAIGGFDQAYRHYGEDADFCLRARSAGYRLGYCRAAVVDHYGERELSPFLRRAFMHGYGSNQIFHRLGEGYRAWRDPLPALRADRALRRFGHSPESFEPGEWKRMARLAQLGYGARIAGSVWAELRRAR